MMKKFLGVFALLIMAITLTGCKSKLEKTFDKLDDAKSMTMIIEMEVPIFGKVEMTTKIEGDKEYYQGFMEEYYLSKEDGVTYKYSQNFNDEWVKEEYKEETEEESNEEIDPTEFKAKWFEKKGEKYILKSDYYDEVFGDDVTVSLFEMIVSDDEVTIDYEMSSGGFVISGSILIKDINKTEVDLPEVN
jgi:hypothetical protein